MIKELEAFNPKNEEINAKIIQALDQHKVSEADFFLKGTGLKAIKSPSWRSSIGIKAKNGNVLSYESRYVNFTLDKGGHRIKLENPYSEYRIEINGELVTSVKSEDYRNVDFYNLLMNFSMPKNWSSKLKHNAREIENLPRYELYKKEQKMQEEFERKNKPISPVISDYKMYQKEYKKTKKEVERDEETTRKYALSKRRIVQSITDGIEDYAAVHLKPIILKLMAKKLLVTRSKELGKKVDESSYQLNIENLFNIKYPHKVIFENDDEEAIYLVVDFSETVDDPYFAVISYTIYQSSLKEGTVHFNGHVKLGTPDEILQEIDMLIDSFTSIKKVALYMEKRTMQYLDNKY